jgi:hypothetical protein
VKATSPDDQVVFMQGMFAAISLHPAVRELTSITDEQRAAFNKKAAALLVRVITSDCRQHAIDALKYEGSAAVQASFGVFAQVAVRGLMVHPRVTEGVRTFGNDFAHDEKLKSLLRDAGIAPEAPK